MGWERHVFLKYLVYPNIATGRERAVKLHFKQYRFRFYVELAGFERHVILNLHRQLNFNRVNIANPSGIVENDEVNLELAEA